MTSELNLRRLTAGRWLAPLLAHVRDSKGSRFAMMVGALGLSRSVLAASLAQLVDAGWLVRNSGHGHPLRPEYVLTEAGRSIADRAARIIAAREKLGLATDELSRWALPAIVALARGEARFSELRTELKPVTPRALSLALKQMLAAQLIDRRLEAAFPPVPIYALTERGQGLAEAIP